MLRFVAGQRGVWAEIRKQAAREQITAALAWLSDGSPIKFRKGDVLIVDASNTSIAGGRTSCTALKKAVSAGAQVRSLPGLHAKVIVAGPTLITGSMNASASSESELIEAAIFSNDPRAVAIARHWIESTLLKRSEVVDQHFLKKAAKIKVKREGGGISLNPRGRGDRRGFRAINLKGDRWWYVTCHEEGFRGSKSVEVEEELEKLSEVNEANGLEAEAIEWPARDTRVQRIRSGDQLFIGSTTTAGSSRKNVYVNAVVECHKKKGNKRYLYYLLPVDAGDRCIRFGEFQRLAQRCGVRGISKSSNFRELRNSAGAERLRVIWPSR